MSRLYSDLLDVSNRRYYFGLLSAPGGIAPSAQALLTINGLIPVVQELSTVTRTPTTALITMNGLSFGAAPNLSPAPAALSMGGLVPTRQLIKVITNALPPDYTVLPDNVPTIVFINTITPTQAIVTIGGLAFNLTQGGNIGFISPGAGLATLSGLSLALPRLVSLGGVLISGLSPNLLSTRMVTPDPQALSMSTSLAATLTVPFVWVDDDQPSTPTWLDDPSP